MKRKYVAMALGMMLAFSSLCVYAEESTEVPTEERTITLDKNSEKLYGEVMETAEDSITLSKGSFDMSSLSGEEAVDTESESEGSDNAESEESEDTSMVLSLSGDAETISVAEDAEIRRLTESADVVVSGDLADSTGEKAADEKETADAAGAEENTEGTEKEASDGDEAVGGVASDQEKSSENTDSEKETDFAADIEINLEDPFDGMETEDISLEDIQVGDIVSVTLDEDGKASVITVLSSEQNETSEEVTEAE